MNHIQRLLLLELNGLPSSPRRLQTALTLWDYDITTAEVVVNLRALETNGLVSGQGISLLHHHAVWLTKDGRERLATLGDDFGVWRRVA